VIQAWFDGAVQPYNPGGHGGLGVVIRRDDEVIHRASLYIGRWPELSNNCAEYAGVITVLRFLIREGITEAQIYGDANLVTNQLSGRWRVKKGAYLPYFQEAWALMAKVPGATVIWIPREQNEEADMLSKEAVTIRPRVIGFELDSEVETRATPKFKTRHRSRREARFEQCEDDEVWSLFNLRYGNL